ncbi:MAG: DEAD/DEAH box helicase [Deltaproteobacteria bacterium]|nr:DEAD/DEAH box helicase [Deltaproteobacteria bacterium]MBW2020157.1 DEAD/DEAH box helicase [Deltaproteobacteria bacterium]MBW2075072.1 DEAD/DEAH box helicase [Deltaproteobacteria bacterium]
MSFENLQLASPILKAVDECGYTAPTPIQVQSIPKVLAGQDLIASAQTGTGKTAAFVLPSLQRLSTPCPGRKRSPRALVLTPTRELAEQITQSARVYGKYLRVKSTTIVGGMPYHKQLMALSQSPDLVIATPGRLLDHLERGRINLSGLELLVLDEADRMLDMGFIQDVEKIAHSAPPQRQTLLFAATLNNTIIKLARRILKHPERVEIAAQKTTHEHIEQRLHVADNLKHKHRMLKHLIADPDMTKAIIFSATKRDADNLARELYAQGHAAAALHGDMNQSARNRTMSNMRRGKIRLLVATDVAARGIDVAGISHIINFDLPKCAEDYVHRIGRTGRAGASGIAISFASSKEFDELCRIERYIGETLPKHVIPGLEPTRSLQHITATKKGEWQPRAQGNRRNTVTAGYSRDKKRGSTKKGKKLIIEYRNSKSRQVNGLSYGPEVD